MVALILSPIEVAEISNLIDEFWRKYRKYVTSSNYMNIVNQGKLVLNSMLNSAAAGERRRRRRLAVSGRREGGLTPFPASSASPGQHQIFCPNEDSGIPSAHEET